MNKEEVALKIVSKHKYGLIICVVAILRKLSSFAIGFCIGWAGISFLIYLVKDKPFDNRTLWFSGAAVVIYYTFSFFVSVLAAMIQNDIRDNLEYWKSQIKQPEAESKWQRRLREMQEAQTAKQNKQP